MSTQIVLASGNKGKLAEFQSMFSDSTWDIVPQSEFSFEEVEETGLSFIENAILKARHAAKHTGLAALADDSGLAVNALQGEPGIYSARYAGVGCSDQDNIAKLLTALAEVPKAERQASFICALAFVRHELDPVPVIALGQWQGEILAEPTGFDGFGYDPVFYVAEHECSAAQLSRAQKNAISHRGRALKVLWQQFQDLGLV